MAVREQKTAAPLFTRHAPRPRLTSLLDESTSQTIVITAPPGYGKTTLAREWFQGRDDVVWYRATSSSADIAAFSAGIAEVVAPLVPGAGERLRQRLRVGDSPERAARPLAELLAEDLAKWPENTWLVVDDYHLVADSAPVEEFVDWLLTLTPRLRILVTTRRRPRWASARRILYGEITEIGREQLAMTHEEASRVLGNRSSDSVRALVTQAEGWPALLGLAALSDSAEIPTERMSEALYRYFAEEVLRQEPLEIQRFMLLASVPVTVSVQMARRVLGFTDPEETIEHLASTGLLQESSQGQLRFHPLLRDFLRRRQEEADPALVHRLSIAVIDHARAAREWDEAFAVAEASVQFGVATEVLVDAAPDLLAMGRIETLERWLSSCGSEVVAHPRALLVRAEVLIRRGALFEAAALAHDLAARLPESDENLARAWHLAGHAYYLSSRSPEALACHRRARALAGRRTDLLNALWGAFLAESDLELVGAEELLDELESLAGSDLNARLRVVTGRQALACHRGSYAGMNSIFASLLPLVEYATDPIAKSSFLAQAAYLSSCHGDYVSSVAIATRALDVSTAIRHDYAVASCLAYRATALIGLRDFDGAIDDLALLEQAQERREDPYGHSLARIVHIKLALSQGDLSRALRNSGDDGLTGDPDKGSRGEYLALSALAHAAAGDRATSLELSDSARSETTSVEAKFYAQFADWIAGVMLTDRLSASHKLSALLQEAQEAEFIHAFVLAYRAWPRLLTLIPESGDRLSAVRRIITNARDFDLARTAGILPRRSRQPDSSSRLTPREEEVLRLLTQGLTNEQISKQLFIAQSTAKVHVHNILRKRGARSRVELLAMEIHHDRI